MLDQFLKIVEENADKAIVSNQAIPNQFNHPAIKDVAHQIFSSLQGQVAAGNIQQVIHLFQSASARGIAQHPLVNPMIENVAGSLAAKFNLSPQVTRSIAESIVPTVISQVVSKTNDPKDIEFDLQHMMRRMSGNPALDISGMLNSAPKGAIGNILGKLFGK